MTESQSMIPAPAPVPSRSGNVVVWIVIALVTVGAVVGVGWMMRRSDVLADRPASGGASVAAAGYYFVYLSQVEVESRKTSGRRWDASDGGPDIRYDVYWRGTRIFRSSVAEDTLIARWDQDEVGIRDVVEGLSSERTMKAARITVTPGESIEFRVVDGDLADDDEIGRWSVPIETLHAGAQTWMRPAPEIRQAVCRVIPAEQSGR